MRVRDAPGRRNPRPGHTMNRLNDPPIGPPGNTPDPESTRAQRMRDPELTARLVPLLDGYLAELEAGRTPDRARLIADHPDLAAAIEEALAGLEFIHRTGAREAETPVQLGDFRIIRELGRGGMGVVYEAEQVSLKRRVALKVLRFTPLVDEVAQQRFQREAETVGHLHHTNIVPIFAVGAEEGVRYYAMQFIEGRDLGRIAREARDRATAPDFREVAGWGLQAADALAHAHQRGVIHRDIKPSNLILDGEGRIWLTDFGLARRLDDVSLSLTGALLGTPRYMSPEQAAAASRPVDHRTDLYSLGATLYELLTGHPIFEAASPHEVLSQILHTEPKAPRQLVPQLPRDLETIVLKCLAKEPGRRYDTAQALARDLRAFADGRSIVARRPGPAERAARWLRQHRRAATVGAASAAVSLLLAAGATTAWQAYRDAQRGRLALASSDPALLAEVLDPDDHPVGPRFALPQTKPLALPAGAYRLRLLAPGQPSQTWPLELAPREFRQHSVGLSTEWLWPPKELAPQATLLEPVQRGPTVDFLALFPPRRTPEGTHQPARLRLWRGADGHPAWPQDLEFGRDTCPPGRIAEEWQALTGYGSVISGFTDTGIADRTRDLDGDGTPDLVLLSRSTPSLWAVSGATGTLLWWHRGHPPATPAPQASETWRAALGQGWIVGQPAVSTDLDGDQVADFVACFRSNGEILADATGQQRPVEARSWLGAVSGRNGEPLWTRGLNEDWAHYAMSSTEAARIEPLARPRIGRVGGIDTVVLVAQGRLRGWNARTGAPAWGPVDTGFPLTRVPQLVDLDGDGQPEAVAVNRRDGAPADTGAETTFELVILNLPAGTPRWRHDLMIVRDHQARDVDEVATELFSVADLDGDGRPEVVAFTQRHADAGQWRFGLEVREGATGATRWDHELEVRDRPQDLPGNLRFAIGPDLDADRWRDVLAVVPGYDFARQAHGIRATALSGTSGARIWQRHHPGVGSARSLAWGPAGADRWPQLLVSCHRVSDQPETSLVLETGSGRVDHVLLGVAHPRAADCDGDGIADLFYPQISAGPARLAVVKGAPTSFRVALDEWTASGDADGDGLGDFVGFENETLAARSGRTGSRLWSVRAPFAAPSTVIVPAPEAGAGADTDPIGVVLALVNAPRADGPANRGTARTLAAFDATRGRQRWTAAGFDLGAGSSSGSSYGWSYEYPAAAFADLDQDHHPEVLVVHLNEDGRTQLAALDGLDGRVRWSTPVIAGALTPDPQPAGPALADFDGDRVRDLAVILPPTASSGPEASCRVTVLDGRQGRPLWPAPFALVSDPRHLAWPEPVLGDLDGDSIPEVTTVRHGGYQEGYRCELVVLDGRSGQVRWIWPWKAGFPELWTPVYLRTAAGEGLFALGTIQQGKVVVQALDASGQTRWSRPVQVPANAFRTASLAWRAADLDGDGASELIHLDNGTLCVSSGPTLALRWRWPLPAEVESFRVLPPSAASPNQAATVVVWADRDVFGLDGADGHPRWRGRAPQAPIWGNSGTPDLRLLPGSDSPDRPILQFAQRLGAGQSTVVRATWPTDASGRYASPRP
jgi:tRNA A-37 threonylcarbamoyl transferase component Bud32/outer membrane protein assembly factor BamB